jgi:hypothetical protein
MNAKYNLSKSIHVHRLKEGEAGKAAFATAKFRQRLLNAVATQLMSAERYHNSWNMSRLVHGGTHLAVAQV